MELAFEEFEQTLTDYSGALEEAFEVIDDLNSTAVVIQDEDQSDVNARLLEVSVESYLKRVGLNSSKYKKQMALESFASSAASNVKKAAILVWEKIKAALTALYKKVTDFFKFLFNKNKETEKKINEAEKELEEDIKEFKKAADAAKKEQGGKVKENPPEYSFNDDSGVLKIGYSSGIQQTPNYVEPTPAKSHKKGSHYLEEYDVKLGLSETIRHYLTHKNILSKSIQKNAYVDDYINDFFDAEFRDKDNAYQHLYNELNSGAKTMDFSKTSEWTYCLFDIGNASIIVDSQSMKSSLVYGNVNTLDDEYLTLGPDSSRLLLKRLNLFYKKYKIKRESINKILTHRIQADQEELTDFIKVNKTTNNQSAWFKEMEQEFRNRVRYNTLNLSIFLNIEKYYNNLINAVLFLIKRSIDVYVSHNTNILREYGYIAAIDDFYKELK